MLDLCPLNLFLRKDKFKMLSLAQVRSNLGPGNWMVVCGVGFAGRLLSHVQQSHRRYPWLQVGQKHLQFSVIPFGLTNAHLVVTKVMVMVATHLRRLGIQVLRYLDNWLLKAGSRHTAINHLQTTAEY